MKGSTFCISTFISCFEGPIMADAILIHPPFLAVLARLSAAWAEKRRRAFLVPQQRRVGGDLTIHFEGRRYFVPFAQVGDLLFVQPAEAPPAVFVFPDGWMPGTSASAPHAHSPFRMRRDPSRSPPPGTGAIARKRRASNRQGIRAARPAMQRVPSPGRRPGSSAGANRAIRLLPLEAEPPAPEPGIHAHRKGSDTACP